MTARRKAAAGTLALGLASLALAGPAASPAAAHGSMTDPVSRVSACYAEGPESPDSAACKAAVAASGTQAFYDWNEVNIGDAAGRHRELIPDGKLCSAGRDKYKGLDLARADWPASPLAAGKHTFRYRATAPHRGTIALYVTKDGYDPAKPLKWSDLEAKPFATVTDPRLENGAYVFQGTVPAKSGRHLVYSVWQRSDSPEAFYTCSDVVFGKDTGKEAGGGKDDGKDTGNGAGTGPGTTAPAPSAPTDQQIEDGAGKSTVDHGGHGGDDHTDASPTAPATAQAPNAPAPAGAPAGDEKLAATGGDAATPYLAVAGAGVLALGAAVVFTAARRAAGRRS
ncbi:lytic polysaccharide monooxygenase [Streptomyces sp. NPDC048604]|uniref:lytic polysaccharide monooxygenase n=1 Tax=Streptomyces sp. NPDC048604 TaxID=3365578 RepID=UPI0037214750